jgi:hypothetical protein
VSAQEECARIREQFVDPLQHAYEVIRPIVLFGETAAERRRQTGLERTTVGDKARRCVLDGMDGLRDRRMEARGAQASGYPEAMTGYVLYLNEVTGTMLYTFTSKRNCSPPWGVGVCAVMVQPLAMPPPTITSGTATPTLGTAPIVRVPVAVGV